MAGSLNTLIGWVKLVGMHLPDIYNYLIRARRDLWSALENVSDELLSRPLVDGEQMRCIKDLLFHIAAVEDGWLREDIQRLPARLSYTPVLQDTQGGPAYAGYPLSMLLGYWQGVESDTLAYLAGLTPEELQRTVTPHDAPGDNFTADGLLWHVMIHEMRHTAQICLLLRMQGIKPPSLDLYFYLPR